MAAASSKKSFFNQEFKDFSCEDLASEIKKLRDELAKRTDELVRDPRGLPAKGPFSIAGHISQMVGKQTRLRKLLNEFNSRNCGCPIPVDAWKYATTDAPDAPVSDKDLQRIAVAIGVSVMVLAAVLSTPAVAATGLAAFLIGMVNMRNA